MKKRILIGVVITDCHVDYQGEILRGIISQAFRADCDVAVLAPLHNFFVPSPHKNAEKAIFDLILSDRFDGFIYDRHTFCREDIRLIIDDLLKRSGKTVMLLDYADHKNFETTTVDDASAFETITDHLIDVHGHRRIYCLTGPRKNFGAEERLSGYKNSMKKHGLFYDKSYYEYGDYWHEAADKFADRIISGSLDRPDAVVCGNDIMAVRLSGKLIAAGIRVPEDIAVTGFDASEEGYTSQPTITSYSRPNFQLGSEACRRLYRIITGRICSKVPNESGSLRIGRSCGCQENISIRNSARRMKRISSSFEGYLLYGDMLFDITNVLSVENLADRIDNYTFLLYKMAHLDICLTRKYIESTLADASAARKLDFRIGDEMKAVLSKNSVSRNSGRDEYFSSSQLLPVYSEERRYPAAYYISPLHYNDNFFGYTALSFGKCPLSFSSIFLQWINYLNVALQHIRIKSMMNNTISVADRAIMYDRTTGLLNRNGIEREFSRINVPELYDRHYDFITVEVTGIKNTYYRSGEEKCRSIMLSFSHEVSSILTSGEICGIWGDNTICVITDVPGRADDLCRTLCTRIKDEASSGDSSGRDFSIGVYPFSPGSETSAADVLYKSSVNKAFSYSTSENTSNPQFEKLCMLRSRIMKNPELSWNISDIADSLFLSKSYLQKIYKSYFGKSIIEEMIEFRMEKAKKLLSQTGLTVTEIARDCGYSSYNYFVRQFRICEGVSPSGYREKVRKGAVS